MDTDKSEAPELKQAEKEAYRKLKNKRRRNVILNSISILLALAGIIWGGVNFFIHYYRYEITNDATVEQYIAPCQFPHNRIY